MAALESSGAEQGDAVICDIDVGSELELAGYRPLLDTRAELYCPELNGGTDAWGAARHVLAGDEDAIEGTGARLGAELSPEGGAAPASPTLYADLMTDMATALSDCFAAE